MKFAEFWIAINSIFVGGILSWKLTKSTQPFLLKVVLYVLYFWLIGMFSYGFLIGLFGINSSIADIVRI